jgi:porin
MIRSAILAFTLTAATLQAQSLPEVPGLVAATPAQETNQSTVSSQVAADAAKNPPVPTNRYASWSQGDTISSTWLGLRTHLVEHGIEPFVYWTGISSGNPLGGYSQGHVTANDDFYLGVRLDLARLVRWHGATLTISGVNRDGKGLTNEYIKSQFNVQQDVGGQSLFFYQLALKQTFADGRRSLRIGRFAASDDLNASPIYSYYLNNAIDGDIRNVLFDTQFSAYPFSTWAALYRENLPHDINLQVAVYQTWKDIFNSRTNGVDWTFHKGDGIIAMAQLGITTSRRARKDDPANLTGSPRLAGHYWLGATYSPWKGYAQFNSSELASNSYGFYAHADQKVYETSPGSDRSLTLWGTLGVYPQQNIAIVPVQATLGAIYQGMFRSRPQDRTILGIIYGNFSRDYARTQIAKGLGDPSYEAVLEIGHRIQATKFLFVQPDLQWVVRPSGTGRYPNAIAAGAEMGITF